MQNDRAQWERAVYPGGLRVGKANRGAHPCRIPLQSLPQNISRKHSRRKMPEIHPQGFRCRFRQPQNQKSSPPRSRAHRVRKGLLRKGHQTDRGHLCPERGEQRVRPAVLEAQICFHRARSQHFEDEQRSGRVFSGEQQEGGREELREAGKVHKAREVR